MHELSVVSPVCGVRVARGKVETASRVDGGPRQAVADTFNTDHGGRGVYFLDPSGHYLEILTRRYGSGG